MMNDKVFLATAWDKLVRAEMNSQGDWTVDRVIEGQRINCMAADPLQPEIVYVGTQGQGVLCSLDRGRTWQPAGLDDVVVKSLAVSPHKTGTIYAGARPAYVYVTSDGGKRWAELDGFRQLPGRWYWFSPAEPPFKAYVLGLTVSPTDPNLIVAGIEAGAVVRSTDGGLTWSGHCKGADRDCHTLTFHVSNGDWIYQGGGGGAAFSKDGGVTWRHPKEGLDRNYGWACAGDSGQPDVWYFSSSPGFSWSKFRPQGHVEGDARSCIFRWSGDGPWEKLGGGLPQPLDYMAYALVTDPAAPGHLYAGLSNGDVWHSADYGDSWRQLSFNLGGIYRSMIMI